MIRRFDWSSIEPWAEFKEMPNGEYMLYEDLPKQLILAKIEVLEEMNERLGGYSKSVEGYCASKIAVLKKGLEHK